MTTSTHRRALSSLLLSSLALLAPGVGRAQTPATDPAPAATEAPAATPAPPAPTAPTATATAAVDPAATAPTTEATLPWLHRGLEIGLRAGFALPFGDAIKKVKESDTFKGNIPIELDVGYRLNRRLYVGAYGEYGFGLLGSTFKDQCSPTKADCSARTVRFGLNVTYHLLTRKRVLPWVGLGAGYQITALKVPNLASSGDVASSNLHGFEFVHAQLGADIVTNGAIRVGPVVEFSLAQNRKLGQRGDSTAIADKAFHEWLTLGIRGAFNL